MIDTKRHWFAGLEKRVGKMFSFLPVTPNQYTLASGLFALGGLYFMVSQNLGWATALFFIAAGLDFVDGAVARSNKSVTKVGSYLDTIVDRYVEGIIYLGMLFLSLPVIILPGYVWIFLALFGSVVTTYAKAAAKEKDLVNQELKGGLMSRGERLFLVFAALILGIIYPDHFYMTCVIIFIAVLANFTALQRIFCAIKLNR